jgi:hypothetical protein
VKTYPVTDGGCATHLQLMLQRGRRRMSGVGVRCAVQTVRGKETLGRLLRFSDGQLQPTLKLVASGLARASDHGVNRVESDCEQHPENRGEEETANDLAYRMGFEEAG